MHTVVLTDAAHTAIRDLSQGSFRDAATKRPDGTWSCPLADVVYLKLKADSFPGEDLSTAIVRLCRGQFHKESVRIAQESNARHLIKFDADPQKFKFIGPNETVDLSDADQFVTMAPGELEKLVGHPVYVGPDGKPTNLTEKDCEILGAAMAVRHAIQSNPNLDMAAKARIFERLKNGFEKGETIEQVVEGLLLEDETRQKIEHKLVGLNPKKRREALRLLRRENRKERALNEKKHLEMKDESAWLSKTIAAYEEIGAWAALPLVMQKPPATMFHKMRQSVLDGEAIIAAELRLGAPTAAELEETWKDAAVFVVEHDWAAAFSEGQDYEGGELKLPDDVCAFEFRISGMHVIAVTFEMDGRLYLQPIPLTEAGWLLPGSVYHTENGKWAIERGGYVNVKEDDFAKVIELLGRQIRAISIALDAEVATSDVVRASHKLNHARERRGKLPVSSYHVVSLARRDRAPRLENDPAEPGTYTKKRLHFRRGHWRHYENHKTWLKWMLVGDPDLGFVDKHYKL